MRSLLFVVPVATVALVGCGDPCSQEPGDICLFAGTPGIAQFGPESVPATESPLYLPQDLTWGPDGNAYLLDFNNHRIRKIDADGMIKTVAGTGFLGDGPEGLALAATFNHPTNLAFSPLDDSTLHVAAWHNSRVESVDLTTGTLSFECGTGARSFAGDGGDAREAALDLPSGVAFDDEGNLYISDQANQIIRKVDLDGIITTIAGTQGTPGFGGDGGPALEAQFHSLVGQAADPSSRIAISGRTLYLADTENQVIRTVDLDTMIVETFAGTPEVSGAADGPAASATFASPRDIAVDDDGTVFVADTENHCVREISPDGDVSTLAGQCGTPGYDGEYGPASEALLYRPYGVSLDRHGNVYVADTENQVFRVIYR